MLYMYIITETHNRDVPLTAGTGNPQLKIACWHFQETMSSYENLLLLNNAEAAGAAFVRPPKIKARHSSHSARNREAILRSLLEKKQEARSNHVALTTGLFRVVCRQSRVQIAHNKPASQIRRRVGSLGNREVTALAPDIISCFVQRAHCIETTTLDSQEVLLWVSSQN